MSYNEYLPLDTFERREHKWPYRSVMIALVAVHA